MLPQSINLYLTYKCTQRCGHCFLVQSGRINKFSLDYEQIIRFLDDAKKNRVFLLAISGGDPLLHPRCFDVLKETRKRGILPLLGSTGVAITKSVAHDIKASGVSCVQVSLDGSNEEMNAKYRGVGVFDRVTASLENLVSEKIFTNLALSLDRHNVSDLGNLLALALDYSVSRVKVDFYTDLYGLYPEKQLGETEIQAVKKICSDFIEHHSLARDWIVSPKATLDRTPLAMAKSMVIEANGDVRFMEHSPILGNIKQSLASEIYHRAICADINTKQVS